MIITSLHPTTSLSSPSLLPHLSVFPLPSRQPPKPSPIPFFLQLSLKQSSYIQVILLPICYSYIYFKSLEWKTYVLTLHGDVFVKLKVNLLDSCESKAFTMRYSIIGSRMARHKSVTLMKCCSYPNPFGHDLIGAEWMVFCCLVTFLCILWW